MSLSSFYRSKEWESLRAVFMAERVNEQGDLCYKLLVQFLRENHSYLFLSTSK